METTEFIVDTYWFIFGNISTMDGKINTNKLVDILDKFEIMKGRKALTGINYNTINSK